MRHNKNKKVRQERVPEIFKDLWGFDFVEEVSFSRVKNEIWPKIHIVVSRDNEDDVKKIKTVLQKYEVPFSNLNVISNNDKKEPGSCKEKLDNKENKKPNLGKFIGGRKPPPFHCI